MWMISHQAFPNHRVLEFNVVNHGLLTHHNEVRRKVAIVILKWDPYSVKLLSLFHRWRVYPCETSYLTVMGNA